jgi:nucleoside-diphosphate-sugar epimerase
MQDRGVTHLIHLAALQVPFVRADPPLGARVNVVGTVTVFEAVRAAPLTGTLAYASSIAAYDPPQPGHEHEQRGVPSTLYGVFKRANEETAGVYWADHGIASVGLRPHTVYGLGRDQGVTSAPTKAMLAAAAGTSYLIPYGGRAEMQHARDVARQFIAAARAGVEGATVLDPPGQPTSMAEVVDAIMAAAPEAAGAVGFDDVVSIGVPEQGDTASFVALLGDLPTISLREGVAETIESFRGLLARGLVKPEPAA